MSEKPIDERDIDEILASIDEMLNQKEIYAYKPSNIVELALKHGAKPVASAVEEPTDQDHASSATAEDLTTIDPDELEDIVFEPSASASGQATASEQPAVADILSAPENSDHDITAHEAESTTEIPLQASPATTTDIDDFDSYDFEHDDDEIDDELIDDDVSVVTTRHRILLTEAFLEPSAQEALPLWIEHSDGKNSAKQTETATSSPEAHNAAEPETEVNVEAFVQEVAEDPLNLSQTFENTELIEALVSDALEPGEAAADSATEMAPIINKYELERLVAKISHDVALKLQQQLQELLPRLVEKSLQQHFERTTKDNE